MVPYGKSDYLLRNNDTNHLKVIRASSLNNPANVHNMITILLVLKFKLLNYTLYQVEDDGSGSLVDIDKALAHFLTYTMGGEMISTLRDLLGSELDESLLYSIETDIANNCLKELVSNLGGDIECLKTA